MDAISPIFCLDNESDLRGIFLYRDWIVDENAYTVFYQPARLLFEIRYEPGPDRCITPLALSARLRHACAERDLPTLPVLEAIAKDAIHAFVLTSELFEDWLPPSRPSLIPHNPRLDDDIPF